MNDVLYMDKGRVTIPKDYRKRHGMADGDTMLFIESKSGGAILRPVKSKSKMTLVQHLRQFKGVEIPAMKFHAAPRI
jgi:AbrB family looped-hinge helix DNA binding protein